jgi:hypothetical protein
MRVRALLVERRRVAADLANVEKGMRDLQLLVARRAITRDRAELVLAQCTDELKRLTAQLADADQSLTLLLAET